MVNVKQIHADEIFIVNQLAHQIWPITYKDILTKKQIDYMLEWMYGVQTLQDDLQVGKIYYLLTENGEPMGFLGLEPNYPDADILRIHKIYVMPEGHGKGLGRALMNKVIDLATELDCHTIHLNVNKYNAAVGFYKHIGFEIVKEEDIDIGRDFLMEDYVMEMKLKK